MSIKEKYQLLVLPQSKSIMLFMGYTNTRRSVRGITQVFTLGKKISDDFLCLIVGTKKKNEGINGIAVVAYVIC